MPSSAKLEATTRDRSEDLIRISITPTLGKLQAGRVDAELLGATPSEVRQGR